MKACKNCNKEHEGTYGSGRFCSKTCARGFSTKAKRKEINALVSETLKTRDLGHERKIKKICLECKKEFIVNWNDRDRIYCSNYCSTRTISTETRENLSKAIKQGIKNGTCKGWKSRKDKKPSYPEKYFISLFENEKIEGWKRDYKVGRWFIDFAFENKMIALEIDGSQHEQRKEHDKIKDDFLKKNNWQVIRIKWFNPINENNKEKLYPQIENFKSLITGGL
jgi:very-short-patch-repair endonuclease